MNTKICYFLSAICLFFWNNYVFALNNLSWNITSDWKDGFCYNFTLNNTSWKEISDWKIYFKLDANTLLTSQWSWNFSHNGSDYIITPLDWNKNIALDSKTDIGFCANGISRPFDITTISDNVIPEKPVVSIPETPQIPIIPENNSLPDVTLNKDWLNVSFSTTSKRDGWYCRNITLKNTSSQTISNWEISFILDQAISWWSAQYSKNWTKYSVKSMDWNKNINSNSQTEIWFCSIWKLYDKTHGIENIFFTNPAPIPTPVPVVPIQPSVPTNPTHSWSTDRGILLTYPIDSWNPKSVDLNWDNKKDYILSLNPWNITKADWIATMSVDTINKKIIYNQDLTNIVMKDAWSYVLSYPEVYVWNKPWWWEYFETNSKLPAQFSDINDLQLKVNYKANFENWLHANIAMEWWFTKNKLQTTWVWSWESEVMVWLYSNWLNPAGQKIWEVTLNLKVNWVNTNEIFEIYKWDIGWEIISYRPKNWWWNSANIELNLRQIFDNFKINTSNSHYDNLYLQGWEFWTETGSPTTTKAKYNWELFQYNVTWILNTIHTNPTIPTTPNIHSWISIPSSNVFAWYYPNRSIWSYAYDKIDYAKFDIINFAFIYPNFDGTLLGTQEAKYPELINTAHKNGKKIVISIWWWNLSYNFLWVTLNNTYRNTFIREVKKFVIENNYDGIDLDWEFPNSSLEWKLFLDLLKDLKKELPWKIVSVAISINYDFFDIEVLNNLVDYVYIMAYDIEWWWNWYAGYNSPLYKNSKMPYDMSLDGFLKTKFFKKKIDRSKFLLGYPLYGRKFNVSEPYMPASVSETIEYKDFPKNCTQKWDDESKSPYLSCGSYYISYDNSKSLEERIQYANNVWFWWVFVWALWQDNGEIIQTLVKSSSWNIQTNTWILLSPDTQIETRVIIPPQTQTGAIDTVLSTKINIALDAFITKNKLTAKTRLLKIVSKLEWLKLKFTSDFEISIIIDYFIQTIDKKIKELQ